jgi:2-C-methyl-D-erythritol 4-phosphate cytidylyltransferase
MPSFAVILPAAGSATRFGGAVNKVMAPLGGVPLVVHSLRAFLSRPDVAMVVIPAHSATFQENSTSAELARCLRDPRVKLCAGGDNRAESVRRGLSEVPASVEWVAVHDAARPMVSQELITRTLAAAVEHGAAVGALPVALTIKEADGPLPAKVTRTVPRGRLWAVQTPQVARRAELARAFDTCPLPLDQVTDDVQLIELAGGDVWLVAGEESNIKVTTQTDLRLAEMLLRQHAQGGGGGGALAPAPATVPSKAVRP